MKRQTWPLLFVSSTLLFSTIAHANTETLILQGPSTNRIVVARNKTLEIIAADGFSAYNIYGQPTGTFAMWITKGDKSFGPTWPYIPAFQSHGAYIIAGPAIVTFASIVVEPDDSCLVTYRITTNYP